MPLLVAVALCPEDAEVNGSDSPHANANAVSANAPRRSARDQRRPILLLIVANTIPHSNHNH